MTFPQAFALMLAIGSFALLLVAFLLDRNEIKDCKRVIQHLTKERERLEFKALDLEVDVQDLWLRVAMTASLLYAGNETLAKLSAVVFNCRASLGLDNDRATSAQRWVEPARFLADSIEETTDAQLMGDLFKGHVPAYQELLHAQSR